MNLGGCGHDNGHRSRVRDEDCPRGPRYGIANHQEVGNRWLGGRLPVAWEGADGDHVPAPEPKSRPLLWIAGGAFVLVLATIIVVGVIGEKNAAPEESASAVSSELAAAPSEQSSPESTDAAPAPSLESGDVVLTSENSPELAALLAGTDYCAPDVAAFAAAHRGQTIAFPGYIGAMGPHGSAKTRYDILINAGDFSETPGPNFQFRDVNTVNDLHWVGSVPDTVGVGTNLSVTAEVDRYEERSCLFLLEPVTTAVR